jgi:hypothetical protein
MRAATFASLFQFIVSPQTAGRMVSLGFRREHETQFQDVSVPAVMEAAP